MRLLQTPSTAVRVCERSAACQLPPAKPQPAAVTPQEVEAAEAKASTGRSLRRLFMARRAERMLASYQREGWLQDQPSKATGCLEIRPAAEMGPIIVCLDTSGSMAGKRETVAKVSYTLPGQLIGG